MIFDTEPGPQSPSRQFAARHPKIKYCVEYLRLTELLDQIMPWTIYHLGNETGRRIDVAHMHGHGRSSDQQVMLKNSRATVTRGPHLSWASTAATASAIELVCTAAAVPGKSFSLIVGLSMITGFDGEKSEADANSVLVQRHLDAGVLNGKSKYFKKTRHMVERLHATAVQKNQQGCS